MKRHFAFIEWLRLQGTSKIIEFQSPTMGKIANQQIRQPSALPKLVLNASTVGASTTCLGSLLQCLTTI